MSGEGSNIHDEVRAPGYSSNLKETTRVLSKQSESSSPEQLPDDPDLSAQPSGPSFIERLPLEILTEVFIHCLPHDHFRQPNKHQAPLLLAQVSTFWRYLSLDTPILWASLEILGKSELRLVDLWLSRSRRYPLSLSVQYDCFLLDYALNIILNHSTHLRHLKLHIPRSNSIFLTEDVHLPLLETLEMFTANSLEHYLVQSLSRCLTAAPRLKSFTWNNYILHHLPIELKWSNLTHLKLNMAISLQDCVAIFSEAKLMTHIVLGFLLIGPSAVDFSVVLPQLQSLIVCAGDDPGPMFNAITVPKLKELLINSRFWPHHPIREFLRRSACPLERLNLYYPPLDEAEFIECLEIVQHTLKEFTIHDVEQDDEEDDEEEISAVITDNILDRLMDSGEGDILCPKIEFIALYNCISCSPGRLADMAQSRLKPSNPIDAQDPSWLVFVGGGRALTLKTIETYDNEAETTFLVPLRSLGLIVKIYSATTGAEVEMEEDDIRLRELFEEDLVTSSYEGVVLRRI